MSLTMPEIMEVTHMSEEELLREVAVYLFQSNRYTLEQASRLLGWSRIDFQRLLASRQIPLHYDVEDFEEDIKTLKELKLL
jgi:predicted HTH domain antitoxin